MEPEMSKGLTLSNCSVRCYTGYLWHMQIMNFTTKKIELEKIQPNFA